MRVCILSPIHSYLDIRVFQKEALTLSDSGYEVYLIAQAPENKTINNIQIVRAPSFNGRLKRFLLQPVILYKTLKINADVYHIHNPDTLLIGFLLKCMGKSIIYDTHEDFSKRILMREWIPIFLRKSIAKLVRFLEKCASKYFDSVIVTQPQMLLDLKGKSYLIENAPILHNELTEKAYEISNTVIKDRNIVRLIYVGGISSTRGILELMEVLSILNTSQPFRLWLIGQSFDKSFINKLKATNGWKYVDFLGLLPQEEAFAYMIKSDIGLVTILDVGDHATTSPNKLFEYQRFGLPFVASNFSKWVSQVSKTGSGLFVDPLDIKDITSAILKISTNPRFREQMSKNGQKYIYQEFNWNLESEKLLNLYNEIIPMEVRK